MTGQPATEPTTTAEAVHRHLTDSHWIYRVVPVALWSVRCNGTCQSTDPHTTHLSSVFRWMQKVARR